jgi:hypothetical protein
MRKSTKINKSIEAELKNEIVRLQNIIRSLKNENILLRNKCQEHLKNNKI